MSHACDTCDPSVGVYEETPRPGIFVFRCCGCGRELWQEHEPEPEYDPAHDDNEGRQ